MLYSFRAKAKFTNRLSLSQISQFTNSKQTVMIIVETKLDITGTLHIHYKYTY